MDLETKLVIDMVRDFKGASNAVIAGGSIRDLHFKKVPKDYDIIIPRLDSRQRAEMINMILSNFGLNKKDVKSKTHEYNLPIGRAMHVNNFTYMDKEFDLIFRNEPDNEEFPETVVKTFDLGINMAYYDGLAITHTREFEYDSQNYMITVHNMVGLHEILKYTNRISRISEKCYGSPECMVDWSKVISLKKEEKPELKVSTVGYKKAPMWRLDRVEDIPVVINQPVRFLDDLEEFAERNEAQEINIEVNEVD